MQHPNTDARCEQTHSRWNALNPNKKKLGGHSHMSTDVIDAQPAEYAEEKQKNPFLAVFRPY
ncbi:MAG TPA: hypothetical protein VN687_08525, partial [Blastocatellia bacterium]|nr:hypothetical protein [Blastocatellia bacterium]